LMVAIPNVSGPVTLDPHIAAVLRATLTCNRTRLVHVL
jgi:hypothetical protein